MINAQSAITNLSMLEGAPNVSLEIGRSAVNMRVLMSPIEMIAWFDIPGTPRPIRFRHEGNVVKVEHIVKTSEEKLAGYRMKVFECQSQIDGQMKRFELKYEMNTCKWFLYKI